MGITLEDSSQSDKNTMKTVYIVISPHNLTNLQSTIQAELCIKKRLSKCQSKFNRRSIE